MTINNYTTLVSAIQNVAEDDGAEFASYIPTAINLAEEKLFRELELPELEQEVQGVLVPNNQLLAKPEGYEFSDHLRIVVDNNNTVLKKKQDSFLIDYWPNSTLTGVPKYYSDSSETTFRLAPTPNSGYTYVLKATLKPEKLSTTNLTNYFTNNVVDCLYYASMIEMTKFMKAWSQLPVWENKYTQAQQSWNVQMMRLRRDGGTTPTNPDNGPNSLKHTITTNA